MIIRGKTFQLPNVKLLTLRKTYRITYSTKIGGKIFAIECKIVKIAKVFPLESFAVYGNRVLNKGQKVLDACYHKIKVYPHIHQYNLRNFKGH